MCARTRGSSRSSNTVEVELARLAGLWLPRIRETPEKLWLGRLIREDAEHALRIEKRLKELRIGPPPAGAAVRAYPARDAAGFVGVATRPDAPPSEGGGLAMGASRVTLPEG
jgi:hypothetical protein